MSAEHPAARNSVGPHEFEPLRRPATPSKTCWLCGRPSIGFVECVRKNGGFMWVSYCSEEHKP